MVDNNKSTDFPASRIEIILGEKMRFNIMVVGESGQGKTTYLHTLLRRYVDSVYLVAPQSLMKKTIEIVEVGKFPLIDMSGKANLEVYLYDSPGFGDSINNQSHIDAIYENILSRHNERNELDFATISDKTRNSIDSRVHCVFYFIASHRMKDIDVEFIEKLCPIVPVVPIIAKADMMTVNERNEHVKAVYERLQELSLKMERSCIFEFSTGDVFPHAEDVAVLQQLLQEDDFAETKAIDVEDSIIGDSPAGSEKSIVLKESYYCTTQQPVLCKSIVIAHNVKSAIEHYPNIFAVVCDLTNERIYPWGKLEIYDMNHSDFRKLQMLMFEDGQNIKRFMDATNDMSRRLYLENRVTDSTSPRPSSAITGADGVSSNISIFRTLRRVVLGPILPTSA